MGEAKQRGTREERIAKAAPKAPKPDRQYVRYLPYSNDALDFLWSRFKWQGDKTVAETMEEARKAKEAQNVA